MLLRRSLFAPRAKLLLLPLPQRRWGSGPAAGGGGDYQIGPANDLQPQPATQHIGQIKLAECGGDGGGGCGGGGKEDGNGGGGKEGGDKGDGKHQQHDWKQSSWKALEAAATTGVSLGVLGYVYPPSLSSLSSPLTPTWRLTGSKTRGIWVSQVLQAPGATENQQCLQQWRPRAESGDSISGRAVVQSRGGGGVYYAVIIPPDVCACYFAGLHSIRVFVWD